MAKGEMKYRVATEDSWGRRTTRSRHKTLQAATRVAKSTISPSRGSGRARRAFVKNVATGKSTTYTA